MTYGELRAGVLAASDLSVRSRRLTTLQAVADMHPVPIDTAVADEWAGLRLLLAQAGRRVDVHDTWIAATALALHVPVVGRDADYSALAEISACRSSPSYPATAVRVRRWDQAGRQAGSRPVRPSSRSSGGASSGTGTGGPNSPGVGPSAAACVASSVQADTDAGLAV